MIDLWLIIPAFLSLLLSDVGIGPYQHLTPFKGRLIIPAFLIVLFSAFPAKLKSSAFEQTELILEGEVQSTSLKNDLQFGFGIKSN